MVLLGCHSSGPYGHAKVYSPTSDEDRAVQGRQEYDPLLAQRAPEKQLNRPLWLFGVVTKRSTGANGAAYIAVSLRTLQQRNLCESQDEDSCRVTVSEREMGRVHLLLPLTSEDDLGEHGVGIGSLLRVVGTVAQDVDPSDGSPILRGTFYRHWPRNTFVTTRAASILKL